MIPAYGVHPEATESAFGRLAADAAAYRPLDTVTVRITGRSQGDSRCTIRVCDPEQRPYFEQDVTLRGNRGTVRFLAGGPLGTHYMYLFWPQESRHSRYTNFRLDCDTSIASGDKDFDDLYPLTRAAMLCGRREYATPAGRFVGYISADTWHFDGIWLRDWIYGLPAYRHWERDMACGLDRFLEQQHPSGMLPDGIERDGRTWRVGLESDVEYIMVLAVWQTWQATGDDQWLATVLPRLEQALGFIRNDPKHWDGAHGLVKRQHSCDTWDFDIDGASDAGERRHVIATCDQSGYVLAYAAMARMAAHLGDAAAAGRWRADAESYRQRASDLLWDGTKFLHHVHLDAIDHGDFDERQQLAMGNTWAMTRGLATPDQSRSIVDEYRRRHAATGDAYPWWSLQPGYPDHLGYFASAYCRQGGYANGGLMPWVGGELCRAAFGCGRERYAVALLREYVGHVKRTGGAQVWYWPNGEAGFRTTNEVPYASWGMAEWLHAALAGLAGVHDASGQLSTVTVSPRWAAADVVKARVHFRYAASQAYCAYSLETDAQTRTIRMICTGSGARADVRVLLPHEWTAGEVLQGNVHLEHTTHHEDASRYVCFPLSLVGVQSVEIRCQ